MLLPWFHSESLYSNFFTVNYISLKNISDISRNCPIRLLESFLVRHSIDRDVRGCGFQWANGKWVICKGAEHFPACINGTPSIGSKMKFNPGYFFVSGVGNVCGGWQAPYG
jgi:hypothetical protein